MNKQHRRTRDAQGAFRGGMDPAELNLTIAANGYCCLANRYIGSILFARDFLQPARLPERLDFHIETILRLVRPWLAGHGAQRYSTTRG